MRTTITIDPDNAVEIERLLAQERSGRALKTVINRLLRLGIQSLRTQKSRTRPYKTEVLALEFKPGFDLARLSRLADSLEHEEEVEKLRGRS